MDERMRTTRGRQGLQIDNMFEFAHTHVRDLKRRDQVYRNTIMRVGI